ncbi:MAG: hypothetical protein D6724_11145 [Armatimonadetes bacterium]|nr:MAG: hypothetical protein D6724_11145 [Armatimonadota bacterium]
MSGGELRRFIEEIGFLPSPDQPDQHFLISERVRDRIVEACEGCAGFLEIGPGPGVLTRELVRIGEVVAVDIDRRAESALSASAPSAQFVLADAARLDYGALLATLPSPRALVSNLPYSITGFVLEALWRYAHLLDRAVLMMQSEVAIRIAAEPGSRERGAISVLLQHSFRIERVTDASPGAFWPPPKVSSRVLRFESKGRSVPTEFAKVVRAGFAYPRKTLFNNLTAANYAPERVRRALEEVGLAPAVRAHEVPQDAWSQLTARLETVIG